MRENPDGAHGKQVRPSFSGCYIGTFQLKHFTEKPCRHCSYGENAMKTSRQEGHAEERPDPEQAVLPELFPHVIEAFLLDHFRAVNLLRESRAGGRRADKPISTNREFWKCVISETTRPLSHVCLDGNFQIVDWFPRSPGLFHTDEAEWHRRVAKECLRTIDGIVHYEPYRKVNMIQGGIGSVRFKPIRVEGLDCWLCTATDDGYCHSGIPIAVPDPLFKDVATFTGRTFSVTGQVRFLPDFMERHFRHMQNIPQVYVLVDQITQQRPIEHIVELTPMVFFIGKRGEGDRESQCVTYVRCHPGTSRGLTEAADWIRWYVGHYGDKIMTNFDQQRPVFSEAPFSLQALMSARVDLSNLEHLHVHGAEVICNAVNNVYSEVKNMAQISVTLGDGTVIKGDFVVANTIKDSFNKVTSSEAPEDVKALLTDLTKAVAKMVGDMPAVKGAEVARDLDSLTSEVTSENPRRKWWELSIDGLTKAAKAAGALGKSVLDILGKLVPLLPA